MTNKLTTQDIENLKRYAERGERQAYWKYLAEKGDPYAKLALQVVMNNTFDGFAGIKGVGIKGVSIAFFSQSNLKLNHATSPTH